MWKSTKAKFMTQDLDYKERSNQGYYKDFYRDITKLFDAIEVDDTEEVLACILIGGLDVNLRLRVQDDVRTPNDIYPLSAAILQYSFDTFELLIKLGADYKNTEIIFTGEDEINRNVENLKRARALCDKYGIKHVTTDMYGNLPTEESA